MLTVEIMRRMWPKAPIATINAIVQTQDEVFAEYEINTPLRVAHFMAQITHECGGGTIVRENMNYSTPERISKIFGWDADKQRWNHSARVTDEEARQLVHNPKALAERVYGLGNPKKAKELGNTRPGDAYRCRGNGMLQLTGAGAHRDIGELIGVPLYDNPEMLEDPATSFRVAAAEFHALRRNGVSALQAADRDDVTLVTLIVNGGKNGLAERTVLLRKWKTVLPEIETPVERPRGAPEPLDKTFRSSKIAQGGMATATSIATGVAAEVVKQANTTTQTISVSDIADKVQKASDTITTVQVAADNATAIVQTVKPFLGLSPATWSTITVIAITAAAVAIGFTLWERYKKLRDQGV